MSRVNYYNKVNNKYKLKKNYIIREIGKHVFTCDIMSTVIKRILRSSYYYDFKNNNNYLYKNKYISVKTGDVRKICFQPTLTKSRSIQNDNENNIILKWDKKRHFCFINDENKFENKKNMLVWRGCIDKIQDYTDIRNKLITNFKSNDIMDINNKEYISIKKQLKYKFILSLEGYDVATNLKWIMNSNSLCFMPKPTCESWFMEDTLIPNFHYVEIKNDFSDLEEKIKYYINNVKECKKIIKNANEYVNQFKDEYKEHIIEVLVMKKYFDNQLQIQVI